MINICNESGKNQILSLQQPNNTNEMKIAVSVLLNVFLRGATSTMPSSTGLRGIQFSTLSVWRQIHFM